VLAGPDSPRPPAGSLSGMSIVNRRNAVLGWGVWKAGKVAAKRKARRAVQPKEKSRAKGKGAILSSLAAVGGAVWFWRRRRSDGEKA
jgi:hypothetical protein